MSELVWLKTWLFKDFEEIESARSLRGYRVNYFKSSHKRSVSDQCKDDDIGRGLGLRTITNRLLIRGQRVLVSNSLSFTRRHVFKFHWSNIRTGDDNVLDEFSKHFSKVYQCNTPGSDDKYKTFVMNYLDSNTNSKDCANRFRSNSAGPTGTWVRLAVQNFSLIATGVGIRPQNCQQFPLFGKESPRRGDSLDRFLKF